MTSHRTSPQIPRTWEITAAPYDSPDVQQLLRQFQAAQVDIYGYADNPADTPGTDYEPPHGLFLLARDSSDRPLGCGGWRLLTPTTGEVKRMYVRPQFRGLGFARLMLDHLAEYTRSNGINVLRLETGIHQRAAITLYERSGFRSIPAFGEYKPDPLRRFYEKQIPD